MDLLRAGKKKCTVRIGTVSVASDELLMSDGRHSIPIRVLRIDHTRNFSELTDQDAIAEGFLDKEELRTDLKKYYPKISDDDLVTVIYFERADSEPI